MTKPGESNKKPETKQPTLEEQGAKIDQLLSLVETVAISQGELTAKQEKINSRLATLETGEADFKVTEQTDDVKEFNKELPKNYRKIVEDTLGMDFKAKLDVETFMLTVYVPKRLSLLPPLVIPVKDEKGKVIKNKEGRDIMETITQKDPRSCIVKGSSEVLKWCTKIKENVLRHYQEKGLPVPKFELIK